jgi:hypothetical protein
MQREIRGDFARLNFPDAAQAARLTAPPFDTDTRGKPGSCLENPCSSCKMWKAWKP